MLALAGAAGAATIVALIVMVGSAARQRDAAIGWQQHSYEAMILARQLDASMGQAEAMLGRFVISGNKDFGRLYFDDWRRAGSLIAALDAQVEEPVTQARIEELRSLYATRGQELAAVALRSNYGQNPQALSLYYAAGKSPNVAQIDALLDEIMTRERTALIARSRAADATIGRSNRFGVVLSITGLLLVAGAGILAWFIFHAAAERRYELERTQELEAAVDDRTLALSEANARLTSEMAEREVAEERLRQAQKMEAVGQLTGGIAHDFNNMLAVVIGGIELAVRRLSSGSDEPRRHLGNALEGAQRAAALTKRLLAFARAEPLLPAATDPNALIAEMSELLDRVIGDTITVRIAGTPGAWPVFVDRHQLENAILNLAVNARDAMERGGTLTVATANVALSEGEIAEAAAGDYVRISVRDTGVGMTRDVLDRVFEPFFTTKPAGKGTGLGLSQLFGFVRQSGGAIAVSSTPGLGTEVSIHLPRHAAAEGAADRASYYAAVADAHRPAPRTVLVIEDDARVLAATVEAVEELGHKAIPCNAAGEAARLLGERPDVGLILSDVLMPGMTGPELIASLTASHGAIPVLFVTGFAGDVAEAEAFGGHEVLRKPFTIGALDAAIARALEEGPAPERRAA